ncbi:hypothetical protein ACHWQZ_G018520 [Mnemiopsis leidyi]
MKSKACLPALITTKRLALYVEMPYSSNRIKLVKKFSAATAIKDNKLGDDQDKRHIILSLRETNPQHPPMITIN